MKLDEKTSLNPESVIEIQEKQEYKKMGSILVKPGCKLYVLNLETLDLSMLEHDSKSVISANRQKLTLGNAAHNDKCVYINAINYKNAERKALAILKKLQQFRHGKA